MAAVIRLAARPTSRTICPSLIRRLTNTQFALDELRVIVEEAEACGTYVCGERAPAAACCCARYSRCSAATGATVRVCSAAHFHKPWRQLPMPNQLCGGCIVHLFRSACLHGGRHHASGAVRRPLHRARQLLGRGSGGWACGNNESNRSTPVIPCLRLALLNGLWLLLPPSPTYLCPSPAADLMAQRGTFLVPTTVTYQQ